MILLAWLLIGIVAVACAYPFGVRRGQASGWFDGLLMLFVFHLGVVGMMLAAMVIGIELIGSDNNIASASVMVMAVMAAVLANVLSIPAYLFGFDTGRQRRVKQDEANAALRGAR